jgi:hypothetical protein
MKKTILFITFIIAFTFILNAQDETDIFSVMNDKLTEDELEIITDAQSNITKAEEYIANAETEEDDLSKYFSSSKKNKKKKGEKKSVEAKQYRIKAATYYDKAYEAIYNLYNSKLEVAEYSFTEDATMAQGLIDDANTSFADGQRVLKTYKAYKEDDLKKTVEYSTLKSDLKSMVTTEEDALKMLADAIVIWLGQDEKKSKLDLEDEKAWKVALSLNTIPAYKSYLASYQEGIHAEEAAKKIEELQEAILAANKASTNVTYKVQILADKKSWTAVNIKAKIYKGTETYTEKYTEGYYKYWIGDFKTYAEAKALKTKCGVKGAFVVCFLAGSQVDILKALEAEGVKP